MDTFIKNFLHHKKTFVVSIFFVLMLLTGAAGFPAITHAFGTPAAAPAAPAATPAATAPAETPTPPAKSPGWLSGVVTGLGTAVGNVAAKSVSLIAFALLSLNALILGLVGSLFNWIVVITVFQFGAYFGNSAGLLTAWGILRDIANIVLLFGFIFMGILIILDLNGEATRKAIPRLIIVALLMNFSLFAAEAVIDVSNVLSSALYTQAGAAGGGQCPSGDANQCAANYGISKLVFDATGLSNIFTKTGSAAALGNLGDDPTHQMTVYIGLAIFVIVTWVVLLAASVMLLIRAITLTFLMVLAPIGFAAMAIPRFKDVGDKWLKTLINQAFFAPVYLLLLLVSLKIMEAIKGSLLANNSGTLYDALSQPGTSFGTIFIVFALVIGFMIAAMMIAKQMGAIGADYAIGAATGAARRSIAAPIRAGTAGAAFAGRRTVGRFSAHMAQNIRKGKYAETEMGRFLAGVADKGASSSFDARNIKAVKGLAGAAKLNIGAPNKDAAHGYHGIEEKATKERLAYAKTLKGNTNETDKMKAERVDAATKVTDEAMAASDAATKEKAEKQKAHNEALLASQSAAEETLKQERILAHVKAQAAQNPTDAALAQRVVNQSQTVAARKNEQSAAEQVTKQAENELNDLSTKLNAANKAMVEAMQKQEAASITKQISRQEKYAANIADQAVISSNGLGTSGIALTAARHANHEAAEKIRKNAGKTDLERTIDGLREQQEKEAEKSEKKDDSGHGDGH